MGAVFTHQVHVRWRDVDALDHVNNAVFLTYLEEGRDAFYAQILGSDPIYVVVRIELDLRAEVRYADQHVTVRIEVEPAGHDQPDDPGDHPHSRAGHRGRGARRHRALGRQPAETSPVQRG